MGYFVIEDRNLLRTQASGHSELQALIRGVWIYLYEARKPKVDLFLLFYWLPWWQTNWSNLGPTELSRKFRSQIDLHFKNSGFLDAAQSYWLMITWQRGLLNHKRWPDKDKWLEISLDAWSPAPVVFLFCSQKELLVPPFHATYGPAGLCTEKEPLKPSSSVWSNINSKGWGEKLQKSFYPLKHMYVLKWITFKLFLPASLKWRPYFTGSPSSV